MKKVIFFFCAILVCFNTFAGKIKVVSGEAALSEILKSDKTMYVEFDWSKTVFDPDEPVPLREELEEGYDEFIQETEAGFIRGFKAGLSEKITKMEGFVTLTDDEQAAQYKMVVMVPMLDWYFAVMHFYPSFKANIWALITVQDVQTGEVIAQISVKDLSKKSANYSKALCCRDGFEYIGNWIGSL